LETNVNSLKNNVGKWENELKTLKARVKVSNATKNLNKQMASIDSSSTVNMLEKMREKVSEEEALADAYGDIANESKSVDDELDRVLDNTSASAESDLDALKKQMGM
jgi:phage shock protein A